MTEEAYRLVRVAFGQGDPTRGDVNRRVEGRRTAAAELVGVDELLELRDRSTRRLQIAGGHGDLDLRRKPTDPRQRFLDLVECARDSRNGRLELPFRKVEQCEAGLGVGSELVRTRVRLLGGSEVAEPTADLADLVVAARGDVALEILELVAGRRRDLLGGLEIAPEPHDLRTVDATGAGEAGHVEPVTPAVGRLRPLRGPANVTDVLARADRHAVDERGRVSLELAADRGRRALVDELEPLLDLTHLDEHTPLGDEREHLRVSITEAPCELVCALEARERFRIVPFREHRLTLPG